ncbi:DUF1230 family protein [Raphidocelis subcapitata]|uniref:DUF1230 family protein n=1 Tax=Raphidocelis subcapitata TaxID=307507 RepID=A0A2V0NPF4_9CHLO|nr:DUF1230 family protein [Raphidocelis subcapitata]|eukprot:GBF89149.1 DUF1230 family protein [Raphidocelis subcapitata]
MSSCLLHRQAAGGAAATGAVQRRAAAGPWRRARPRGPAPPASSRQEQQQQQQQSPLADLEMVVPWEQRPSTQLQELKQAWLYSWATLPQDDYVKRLASLFLFFSVTVGGPISFVTFDPLKDPAEFLLATSVGSLLVVAVACLRIFLGWKFVGDRLFSATVAYEETGWYDGAQFVKPPEVLGRDRLLGTYEVRPALAKLRSTMVGAAALLVVCSILLSGLIRAGSDEDGVYGRGSMRTPRQVTASGVIYSKRVKDLSQLAGDDELAAAEAAAMGGVPGYCSDRMLRAASGGLGCPKF